MERNVAFVKESHDLREGAEALTDCAVELARTLLAGAGTPGHIIRGGRKAHRMETEA